MKADLAGTRLPEEDRFSCAVPRIALYSSAPSVQVQVGQYNSLETQVSLSAKLFEVPLVLPVRVADVERSQDALTVRVLSESAGEVKCTVDDY